MKRYTIKELHLVVDQNKANNKLCQLEDIEEEIDIDLVTLFKALKNGIYMNGTHYEVVLSNTPNGYELAEVDEGGFGWSWCLKDYGKNWFLTKEESERK